ncbi:DMT family transporter [Peribacillus alkalitolerans]|uniref:DMT family transporter n=1 Tax=Peribacillus alkalitolerans TaxID=1550385 RepID=UPI0013D71F1F|nr:DMT family transporter [Peribacillus alkalitolerans]
MKKVYGWLILCVTIWGSNFVIGKILVQDFSPAVVTSIRLLFITVFLLFFLFIKEKTIFFSLTKRDWGYVGLLGIIGIFINQWSFFIGLETADSTTSAIILATTPVFTSILAFLFLKERINLSTIFGLGLAISGVYVVTSAKTGVLSLDSGLWWITLTMVTFSIMIIMTRFLTLRIDPLILTVYSNVIGFLVSVPFIWTDQAFRVSNRIDLWLLLIISGIIVHGVCNLIWNYQIKNIQAFKASMLSNLEPFIAMVSGFFLLQKPILLTQVVGAIFILIGVFLSTREKKVFFRGVQQ